jgi:hypothetical protein
MQSMHRAGDAVVSFAWRSRNQLSRCTQVQVDFTRAGLLVL